MSRFLRVLVGAALTMAVCALGLVLKVPPASYGYDASRNTATSGVEATPGVPLELGKQVPAAIGDVLIAYDNSTHLARGSAPLDGYRLAPRATSVADDLAGAACSSRRIHNDTQLRT